MKKLSIILLIAIIALSIQRMDDEENSNERERRRTFTQFILNLPSTLKTLYDHICKGNYWYYLYDLVAAELKDEAIEFCVSIFPKNEEECTSFSEKLNNWVLEQLKPE